MKNDPLGLFDEEEKNTDPLGLFGEGPATESVQPGMLSTDDKKTAIKEGLTGMVDTAMGMASGLPSQIAGGVLGLSTLMSGQGLDAAANKVKSVQESNFGMGAYQPFSKKGQEYTEKASEVMEYPIKKAGDLGYMVGGELGRTNAEIATESLMNLVEPAVFLKGGRAGMRRMIDRSAKGYTPDVAATVSAQADIRKADAEFEANALDRTERRAAREQARAGQRASGDPIYVDPTGDALVPNSADPLGLFEARDMASDKIATDMEAIRRRETANERPNLTSLEDANGQQSLFDQGDQMGQRNQFNAGDLGDWRIDENGIPVRVDKTLDAMNVEAPLQRGLFGDELPNAGLEGTNVPITQAIDNTPANGQWAQRKGMTNRLGGNGKVLEAGPDLLAAMNEANGPNLPFNEATEFSPRNPMPYNRLGDLPAEAPRGMVPDSAPEAPRGSNDLGSGKVPEGVTIQPTETGFVAIKDGQVIGKLDSNITPEQNQQLKTNFPDEVNPAEVSSVGVNPEVRGTGVGRALYDAWRQAHGDNVTPSGKITPDAWKYWKRNAPEKVNAFVNQEAARVMDGSPNALASITDPDVRRAVAERADAMKMRESDTLSSAAIIPANDRPPLPDTVVTPRSPEKIVEKQKAKSVAERIMHNDKRLSEFETVATPEEVNYLLEKNGYKDQAPGIAGKNLGSGANWAAITTNNPVIKFVNTQFRDARTKAEAFSRQYITAKDGISPTWSQMNGKERNAVRSALLEGDRKQFQLDSKTMDELGFSEKQKQFVNKYYEANEAMFTRWNEVSAEMGLKPISRREGHVPGVFKGAYKAIVTDAKGTVGVISADSVYEMRAAKKYMESKRKDITIVEQKRKGLADFRGQSDIFSGMNDVMKLLAEHDPKFAEVQDMVSEAVKHGNNSIYAFNKHELSKKGVIGNEGNKPWLDADKNTEAWFKSMVQYFEEGALHHELQKPLAETKKMATDLSQQMPKTASWVDQYTKHVTGQSANNVFGNASDAIIDMVPKMVGYGPAPALRVTGAVKNRMSQIFMGWGNWMFTAAQLAQPLQTGAPMLQLVAGRIGKHVDAPKAMFNGGSQFMLAGLQEMTGKKMGVQPHMQQAYDYAKERGILNFSEMERAYQGTQTKLGRGIDKVAEANMKIGEVGTRTPMFMSFVDMLYRDGVPMDRALSTAENLVQASMVDYHQWERPQVYAKMGVLGQFAGGLTTFKHSYVGQQGILGKEAVARRNPLPIALSAASMLAFAGIAGMPFYDELDELHGMITDKLMGKRQNIRDTLLSNLPEWAQSGLVSNASGVSVQSKFSSANMIPDMERPGAALSPQIAAAGQVFADGYDVLKNGDKQAYANFLMGIAPSGPAKGIVENFMLKKERRDEDGNVLRNPDGSPRTLLLGKEQQAVVERNANDWNMRMITGQRPHHEVLTRENEFKARQKEMADTEALMDNTKQSGRQVMNGTLTPESLEESLKKQVARGGDAKSIISNFTNAAKKANMTDEERRTAGIKNTPGSMRKFEYYNKPGER